MERVTGIGGIFFKAKDPAALSAWYRDNLGITPEWGHSKSFSWAEGATAERPGMTVWAIFESETSYFEPSRAPFMINYRVENLDRMLAQLRAAGARVDDKVQDSEYGRFGWVLDPEDNRIELWEPPAGS